MEMQVLESAVEDTVTSDGGTNVDVAEWKAHAKIEDAVPPGFRRFGALCSQGLFRAAERHRHCRPHGTERERASLSLWQAV